MIPATSTAGPASAFTDIAAPAARPTYTASASLGWWRYRSASATASTENASAGPSAFTGPVTQSTEPLVVTKPAASRACARVVSWRAHEYGRDGEQDARRDREHARCVDRAEADQIAEPHEREEQCALAREHVAEGQRAGAHRERRRREDAVVEHERARREERGEAQHERDHPEERSIDAPGSSRVRREGCLLRRGEHPACILSLLLF